MATAEPPPAPIEREEGKAGVGGPAQEAAPAGGGLMQRFKAAVGLGGKEEAGKRDVAEEERAAEPTGAAEETALAKERGAAGGGPVKQMVPPLAESPRVQPTKLLKPQEVEVGLERPQLSPEDVGEAPVKGGPFEPAQGAPEPLAAPATPAATAKLPAAPVAIATTAPATPTVSTAAMPATAATGAHPAEAAAARLVETGAHPGRIGEGAAVVGGTTAPAMRTISTAATPPTGAAATIVPVAVATTPMAAATGAHPAEAAAARLVETGARPGRIGEGAAVVGGAAGAAQEAESALGAPPSPKQGDRVKVDRMGGPAAASRGPGGIPSVDVRPGFETAPISAAEIAGMKAREHAIVAGERERVAEAKRGELHALRGKAEHLEVEAQGLLAQASQDKLRRDQREWSGYAQAEQAEAERRKVLERRAQALVKESSDMAELAMQRQVDAERLAAALTVKLQEQQEWQVKVDSIDAGDLPRYVEECQAEIGRLSRRIAELREEVDWARLEMEKLHSEGATWERVLASKKSEAALLMLRMAQAREEAEAARARSQQAAHEAREPTDLAEGKYEEAQHLAQEADELDGKARQAQQEALTVVRQAVEPERTRQERLREAAEAELRAKQLEQEVQLIQGKMERRLAEAEARGETAAVLAAQAEQVQEQAHVAATTAEAAREMEEMYGASQERHAGLASQLDRVGVEPKDERARELMRAQRERYASPGALLAQAPSPPTHTIPAAGRTAAASAGVEEAEGASRVPVPA
ncbi:hypothetical protein C2E21_7813 [Chlorella sorokiniana]|uniref:Uncharacterized protein n=1 Tax=Chlorella sorokiniana TaxID=3076 RepID=A0A2P6TGN5_CHLSO|nr:hypothetical protein C2E21_7813 [Chlorella sorokiniana]|eukprot:PRW33281.1 hypothetical protein C2E21_7813 [Chlorella sorokiniana]